MVVRSASLIASLFSCFLCALTAWSEVSLPKMLSDHVVLQRDQPIHLWGSAAPGEQVTIALHDQKQSTTTTALGQWSVFLMPEHAGGPYQLIVQGTNTITLSDVLIGDVWFASGQSNMEMPLSGFPNAAVVKDSAEEIAHANQPEIRLLHIPRKSSDYPLSEQDASWTACTPETAADFSAVGYFFGREIQQREHVPIGLIDSTWGGTPAEAWISLDALASDASLMPVFRVRAQRMENQASVSALVAQEKLEDAAAKQANLPRPKHPYRPAPESWAPSGLFNGMVAPEIGFAIKGVIWYQGESNSGAGLASMYSKVFPALISNWRTKWGEGNFPFLFVQISSFHSPNETWGIVRDAQRRTLDLVNTGMAVTLDVGNAENVHPADKQTVGHRLALAARALVYGEPTEYSGPLFRQVTAEGNNLRVWFEHTTDGLSAKGGPLTGFEMAGADHHFEAATARIEGTTVLVTAPDVKLPVFVRYAWANVPEANLYNGAGLPASTFTSETEPAEPCTTGCGK
ncbi:MAG TPA: sialate O-acetylesterase [Acidobacteriaceae bacterium]